MQLNERLAGRVAGRVEVVLRRAVETAFIVEMRGGRLYVPQGRLDAGAVIGLKRGQQAGNRREDVIGRGIAGPRTAPRLVVEDLLGGQSDRDHHPVGIRDLSGTAGLKVLLDCAIGRQRVLRLRALVAAEDVLAVRGGLAQADQLLQDALHLRDRVQSLAGARGASGRLGGQRGGCIQHLNSLLDGVLAAFDLRGHVGQVLLRLLYARNLGAQLQNAGDLVRIVGGHRNPQPG